MSKIPENMHQNIYADLYKTYVEDLGRIGTRHENARTFYITLLSVLFTVVAMAGKDGAFQNIRLSIIFFIAVIGCLICIAWYMHMRSFRITFAIKFKVIKELEANIDNPISPFTREDELRHSPPPPAENNKHYSISSIGIDQLLPSIIISLFIALLYFKAK